MDIRSLVKNKLVIIIAVSFLVSAAYSFWHRIPPLVDAQAYDQIALNLLAGNGFKENAELSFDQDTAMLRAGPGYEFFLAGIYGLFGHHYEAVWIIQALLHALTAYLMYWLGKELFPEKGETIGLVAAALIGLSPDLIEISAMLMTETLYLFFTVLIAYLFVKNFSEKNAAILSSGLGLVLAIGILTRPPLVLFAPIIFIAFLWQKKNLQAFNFTAWLLVGLAPWIIRNYLVHGQFILTTLIGDFNIWVGNTLHANGGQLASGFNPVTDHVAKYGVGSLPDAARTAFLDFITRHPLEFIKLCALRFVRYFSLIRPMGFWFYQTGWSQLVFVALSGLSIALMYVSGLWGMVKSWTLRQPKMYFFLALGLSAPLFLFITVVESRYRFQIYPFLAIFGSYALVNTSFSKQWWKQKEFFIPALFLLLVSLIDLSLFSHTALEHLRRFF